MRDQRITLVFMQRLVLNRGPLPWQAGMLCAQPPTCIQKEHPSRQTQGPTGGTKGLQRDVFPSGHLGRLEKGADDTGVHIPSCYVTSPITLVPNILQVAKKKGGERAGVTCCPPSVPDGWSKCKRWPERGGRCEPKQNVGKITKSQSRNGMPSRNLHT